MKWLPCLMQLDDNIDWETQYVTELQKELYHRIIHLLGGEGTPEAKLLSAFASNTQSIAARSLGMNRTHYRRKVEKLMTKIRHLINDDPICFDIVEQLEGSIYD